MRSFRSRETAFVLATTILGLLLVVQSGAAFEYEPEWTSLEKHNPPEWFRDAKFGIYTHWGPITCAIQDSPRSMGWYGSRMYKEDNPAFKYHREHFGDQNEFGYKEIIPRFKAKEFDADRWAELFKNAGARFAGPVAVHHDNYLLWDSEVSPWNSVEVGPGRDITGELAAAIRERGMKFLATFHHGFTWRYYEPAYEYDAGDPQYSELYCEPHEPDAPPTGKFQELWLAKVNEVLHKYEPDIIWFDFGLGSVIQPEYQRRMFADYYNWAASHSRRGAVAHKHRDIHKHTGILDFERGREDRLTEYPWLTDTSIGPWFHHKDPGFKSVNELVDVLVDIVSKNGCMLLNVGPDAEGRIPEPGRKLLLGLGKWLDVNGEAIYHTRPWKVYGEGPTEQAGGAFSERQDTGYGGEDLRFTRSKDGMTLYLIALGWPEGDVTANSMQVDSRKPSASVVLLGYDGSVDYRLNEDGQPVIEVPDLKPQERPCGHAYAFKLTGFEVSVAPEAAFWQPGAVTLKPEAATLEGERIKVQDTPPGLNIGFWDNPEERVHWLVKIAEPGTYGVRGELASAYAPSGLELSVAGQSLSARVPKTNGWADTKKIYFGRLKFTEAGVYHLILRPQDPKSWKAVNVHRLQLARFE